jgi:hypothetical protein
LLQPYAQKLTELDTQIKEAMQKIHLVKTNIVRNDETISKMLAMVVH